MTLLDKSRELDSTCEMCLKCQTMHLERGSYERYIPSGVPT